MCNAFLTFSIMAKKFSVLKFLRIFCTQNVIFKFWKFSMFTYFSVCQCQENCSHLLLHFQSYCRLQNARIYSQLLKYDNHSNLFWIQTLFDNINFLHVRSCAVRNVQKSERFVNVRSSSIKILNEIEANINRSVQWAVLTWFRSVLEILIEPRLNIILLRSDCKNFHPLLMSNSVD